MYARIEYPLYFLEIYLSESERETLLKLGKLEGELFSLVRFFPAFGKGNKGFGYDTSKLKIELGKNYCLNNTNLDLNLILDRNQVEQNTWNIISSRRKGMHVYFNGI